MFSRNKISRGFDLFAEFAAILLGDVRVQKIYLRHAIVRHAIGDLYHFVIK